MQPYDTKILSNKYPSIIYVQKIFKPFELRIYSADVECVLENQVD